MNDWIIDILKVILPGLIIAVITSFLTVRFAIRRFHEEKWWEKKQEMYSKLLDTLHHLKNYASEYYENQLNPNHLSDEKRIELTNEWKKFSRKFAKLQDLASFHLSYRAVNILEEYKSSKIEARRLDNIFDMVDQDFAAISKCLEKLKEEAKIDLKVK